MINIEQTDANWVASRFKTAPKADLDHAVEIWKIKDDGIPVFIIGVMRKDMIGWAEIWVILTEALEYHWWSSLRQCRRLTKDLKERYPGLIAHTRPDGAEERFAKFFGFREVMRTKDFVRFIL